MASSRRAEARLRAEAKASRSQLNSLLAGQSEVFGRGTLFGCVTAASRSCSGVFEKAYLAKLAARLTGIATAKAELLGVGAELAMFSALTVDDWIDRTPFRAGRPAIHLSHGPTMALLAAACLGEAAHDAIRQASYDSPKNNRREIERAFARSVLSIQAGQALLEENDAISASPGLIDKLARARCGQLIGFTMGSAGWIKGDPQMAMILTEVGEWAGIALQHRNDIQDFTVSFDQDTKPPLADLLNGQPNLVLAHLFHRSDHLSSAERSLLAKLCGRNKKARRKPASRTEFSAVLRMIAHTGAGRSAMLQLIRSVQRANMILASHFPANRLAEWRDFAFLLQRP